MLNIQDNGSHGITRIFVVSYKRKMLECVWVGVCVSVCVLVCPLCWLKLILVLKAPAGKVALRCIWNGIRSRNEIRLLSSSLGLVRDANDFIREWFM